MKNEKYLHQFRVVAEHQSVSTACNELHITQSALTKNIKKIEERLGVQLFERQARGMTLTPFGEILLERVKKMELEYSYALNDIANLKAGRGQKLKIGCELMWGEAVLPGVINEMYDRYPAAEIDIVSGTVPELSDDLAGGKLDLLLGNADYMFHEQDHVKYISLTTTHALVMVHREHPLAQFGHVTPSDLVSYDWVLYSQWKQSSNQIKRYCMSNGLPHSKISLKTCYFDIAVSMLKHKNCLLLTSNQLESKRNSYDLVALPLTIPFPDYETGIWGTSPSLELSVAKSFVEIVQRYVV